MRSELRAYKAELADKPEIIVLNKVDALPTEDIEQYVKRLEHNTNQTVWTLSGVAGTNVPELLRFLSGVIRHDRETHGTVPRAALQTGVRRSLPYSGHVLSTGDEEKDLSPDIF